MADTDWEAMLSKEEILQAVQNDLKTNALKLIRYSLRPASDNPMGFLGIHVKVQADVEVAGETKTVQYFAKKIPVDIPSHNAYAKGTGAFYKEINFYQKVVRDIEKNMTPGRQLTKWCPEFYFARGSDIFVVEDLTLKDYYMYPERTELDLDHVLATVKAMAAMHAGPFILEEKLKHGRALEIPEGWKKGDPADPTHLYPDLLFETEANGDPTHCGNTFYEAGIKSQLAIVDLLPDFTEGQKENIKKRLPNVLRRMFDLVKPSTVYRNTWLHGDLWSNNIMFHKNSEGAVDHAVIIDFQLARIAPPAHDLIMFVHLVQSKEFRNKNLQRIQEEYYEVLRKEVEAEGFEVQSILPHEEFIESCSHYYEFSLLTQVLYYQLILSPTSITSKFLSSPALFDLNMLVDRTQMVTETFKTDELCRARITESMMELIQLHKMAD